MKGGVRFIFEVVTYVVARGWGFDVCLCIEGVVIVAVYVICCQVLVVVCRCHGWVSFLLFLCVWQWLSASCVLLQLICGDSGGGGGGCISGF